MNLIRILCLVMILVSTAAYAKTEKQCVTNPLYCKIIKLNPKLDYKTALELSDKIYRKSKANGIDPNVSLAILMQESGLINQNTYKEYSVSERYCDTTKCYIVEKRVKEAFDI